MSKTDQLWAFARFLIVGGSVSLIFAFSTAALVNFAHTPPLPTSVFVYLLCIPAAFTAQKKFTFRDDQSRKSAIWLYAATQLCSLSLVSTVTTRFVTMNFYIDTALFLLTAGLAAVGSYLMCRYVVFKPQSE